MKKKIKEVIVVEGKDDISAVKNAVDAEVFQVNGHAVRKNRSIEFLKLAYENKGLIILTDPDYAGEEIRKYLCKHFPNAKNAYISRVSGTKDGDIGVENASPEDIITALEKARFSLDNSENIFDLNLMMDYGLIGKNNSSDLRAELGSELGIGYSNAKQFMAKLNRYGISLEEFKKAYEKNKKQLNNLEVKMKKLLLALFVMCSALSFSAKVIKANNAEVRENNIVYEAGQNAPYTGIIETYNEKGVLEAKTEFKNGIQDGSSKIYYPSGKLYSEATFQNGKQVGVQKRLLRKW